MNSKYCVCTAVIGAYYEEVFRLTGRSFEAYCSKCNLDLHVIRSRKISTVSSWRYIVWEKFQTRELLETYDGVLFIDADCIIRDNCRNLFDVYSKNFAVATWRSSNPDQVEFARWLGLADDPRYGAREANSGVFLVRKEAKQVLDLPAKFPPPFHFPLAEQHWVFINTCLHADQFEKMHGTHNSVVPKGCEIFHAVLHKGNARLDVLQRESHLGQVKWFL